jgi:hypothetical protein
LVQEYNRDNTKLISGGFAIKSGIFCTLLSYFCRQATAEKPTAIFEKILKFKLKIL